MKESIDIRDCDTADEIVEFISRQPDEASFIEVVNSRGESVQMECLEQEMDDGSVGWQIVVS